VEEIKERDKIRLMSTVAENNKRIAKNTVLLYLRMFVTMGVSLFTSRVVLQTLGETDFGIYNIVGGIVVLFSFFNNAMSASTQRFLSYEIGKNDFVEVKKVFNISLKVHILLVLVILLLAETVGLWFLNTQMNIPSDRMYAASWVYQFSIITFCINIIKVSYNATIIAYEKMNFYAYLSIIEVVLKLAIVYLLIMFSFDRLILYSILTTIVSLILLYSYKIYCNKTFIATHYEKTWDKRVAKKIISFSSWSLFGSVANVGAQQGLNVLLNIFYGVVVNAAVGIANQITHAIYGFISNFQTAFNPQIVKLYAAGNKEKCVGFTNQVSKFSYFLLLFISVPVLICTDFILQKWLGVVPEYTAVFCRLIIVYLLIEALTAPFWMSVQATGKIRNYQILISSLIILSLPLSYFALKMGYPPYVVWLIRIFMNFVCHIVRIIYLKVEIKLSMLEHLKTVIVPIFISTILVFPIPLLIHKQTTAWSGFTLTLLVSVLCSTFVIYFIGFNDRERKIVFSVLKKNLARFSKKE